MDLELEKEAVVVVGAGKGLGRVCAYHWPKRGTNPVICGRSKRAAVRISETTGREVLTCPGNLEQDCTLQGFVNKVVDHFGLLDMLVNTS